MPRTGRYYSRHPPPGQTGLWAALPVAAAPEPARAAPLDRAVILALASAAARAADEALGPGPSMRAIAKAVPPAAVLALRALRAREAARVTRDYLRTGLALGDLWRPEDWQVEAPPPRPPQRRRGVKRRVKLGRSWGPSRSGLALAQLVAAERLSTADEALLATTPRPRTRGDCLKGGINAARPCPFTACSAHLGISVTHRKGPAIAELSQWMDDGLDTCALDVADREAAGAVERAKCDRSPYLGAPAIGRLLGLAKAGVQYIEEEAARKMVAALAAQGVDSDEVRTWLEEMAHESHDPFGDAEASDIDTLAEHIVESSEDDVGGSAVGERDRVALGPRSTAGRNHPWFGSVNAAAAKKIAGSEMSKRLRRKPK